MATFPRLEVKSSSCVLHPTPPQLLSINFPLYIEAKKVGFMGTVQQKAPKIWQKTFDQKIALTSRGGCSHT